MKIKGLRYECKTTWYNVWGKWLAREGTRKDWQHLKNYSYIR